MNCGRGCGAALASLMRSEMWWIVTGATGKQRGAVVKNLLVRGHEVRAVTRSADSSKARELASAGVLPDWRPLPIGSARCSLGELTTKNSIHIEAG